MGLELLELIVGEDVDGLDDTDRAWSGGEGDRRRGYGPRDSQYTSAMDILGWIK